MLEANNQHSCVSANKKLYITADYSAGQTDAMQSQRGFTLVELAIVLVIIGLIIGGVLVGQDMIKAAEIRSTISQWESFNAAVNTFRDKYGYIPGDINQNRALEYGFYDRTGAAASGNGDGNGLLQACAQTTAAGLLHGCETAIFWRDLNDANMVEGYFQQDSTSTTTVSNEDLILWFPEAALGRGNFWTVFSAEGKNWYQLTGITSTASGAYTLTLALTPVEAFNIDRKTDDNRPLTGGTRALDDTAALNVASTPAAPAAGICVSNADNSYNQTTEAYANTPACQLRMRFN